MGSQGGCYKCLKYLLFVFNFLFSIMGLALIAVGIWILVDSDSITSFITDKIDDSSVTENITSNDEYFMAIGIIAIVVGFLTIVISFFGFCGALRENVCMLGTFCVFTMFIAIALIVAGIVTFAYADPLKNGVLAALKEEVDDKKTSGLLNYTSYKHSCCGIIDVKDKKCPENYPGLGICKKDTLNCERGCHEYLWKDLEQLKVGVGSALLVTAAISLIGFLIGCTLCCASRG